MATRRKGPRLATPESSTTPGGKEFPKRPENERIALTLQGGGALGAYQAGVYQALEENGFAPDWVAGTSIGAINGAIIAGNPPSRRTERLKEFWHGVADRFVPKTNTSSALIRQFMSCLSAWNSVLLGRPGFCSPERPLGGRSGRPLPVLVRLPHGIIGVCGHDIMVLWFGHGRAIGERTAIAIMSVFPRTTTAASNRIAGGSVVLVVLVVLKSSLLVTPAVQLPGDAGGSARSNRLRRWRFPGRGAGSCRAS